MIDLLISNVRIVAPKETFHGSVAVKDEKIVGLFSDSVALESAAVIDGGSQFLIPGGVDPHVHIRYPAHSSRETFETGTAAAAAGGTTTILEHPISVPPTFSRPLLESRGAFVEEQSFIDVGFLGAAGADHLDLIADLAGPVFGFKTFLQQAPAAQVNTFEGLTCGDNDELVRVLREVAKTRLPLAVHSEDDDLVTAAITRLKREGRTDPLAHCESRPPIVEVIAVQKLLRLARETGARVYLVHTSVPEAVEMALEARSRGLDVHIETCPHYLFRDDQYLVRFGALAKNTPALRSRAMADSLWKYVVDGSIDVIASDHGPYTLAEKTSSPDDIFAAPNGYAGIEIRLPLMLHQVAENKISLQQVVELLSTKPAEIFGLKGKGSIQLGKDADFVLLDPFVRYTLDHTRFLTKSRDSCSFMDGEPAAGKILKTIVRGTVVYDNGTFTVPPGFGKWIRRT